VSDRKPILYTLWCVCAGVYVLTLLKEHLSLGLVRCLRARNHVHACEHAWGLHGHIMYVDKHAHTLIRMQTCNAQEVSIAELSKELEAAREAAAKFQRKYDKHKAASAGLRRAEEQCRAQVQVRELGPFMTCREQEAGVCMCIWCLQLNLSKQIYLLVIYAQIRITMHILHARDTVLAWNHASNRGSWSSSPLNRMHARFVQNRAQSFAL
jgi:hypothetical protein